MKKILLVTLVTLTLGLRAFAQWTVIDPANLEQAILQLIVVSNQLLQAQQLLKQLGDAATIQQVAGAAQTIAQLAQASMSKPQVEVNITITGEGGLNHDGHGNYRAVEPEIELSDGQRVARPGEDYRKFAAVQQAASHLESVTTEALARRNALRAAQAETVQRLDAATTDAEAQKLKGIQSAQASELASLHAEISEAAVQVLVQHAANEEDRARQEQADLETRAAHLHSALRKSVEFFRARSRPTLIPDPRTLAR